MQVYLLFFDLLLGLLVQKQTFLGLKVLSRTL